MEIKILEEKENKLFNRKEIKFELSYEQAPPKREEIINALTQKLGTEKETTIVRRIRNVFGLRKSVGLAEVYNSPEDLKKYVSDYLIKRWHKEEKKEGEGEQ